MHAGSWPLYDVLAGRESGSLQLQLQLLPPNVSGAGAAEGTGSSASQTDSAADQLPSHGDQAHARQLGANQALHLLKARRAGHAAQPAQQSASLPSDTLTEPASEQPSQESLEYGAPGVKPAGAASEAATTGRDVGDQAGAAAAAKGQPKSRAGCVQLQLETLTGVPVNTAAQWYISYLFPGRSAVPAVQSVGAGLAVRASRLLLCSVQTFLWAVGLVAWLMLPTAALRAFRMQQACRASDL